MGGAGIFFPPPTRKSARTTASSKPRGLHSIGMFPNLSAELRERTGIDNGYRRCGGLEVFPAGAEAEKPSREWLGDGASAQIVDAAEARRLEPNLGAEFAGRAVYLPDMAQVRNPRHLKGLIAACQALGVALTPGCAVHSLDVNGGRIAAVGQTSAGPMHAGQIVLTAGAWTDPLLEPLGFRPGIRPIRGQIVLLQAENLLRHILLRGERYLVPRPDGRVLVGATEEDVGFDKRTTAAAIEDLLRLAIALVPGFVPGPRGANLGGAASGKPRWGRRSSARCREWKTCSSRRGISGPVFNFSPRHALLLKELVLRQPLTLPIEAFRLDR